MSPLMAWKFTCRGRSRGKEIRIRAAAQKRDRGQEHRKRGRVQRKGDRSTKGGREQRHGSSIRGQGDRIRDMNRLL